VSSACTQHGYTTGIRAPCPPRFVRARGQIPTSPASVCSQSPGRPDSQAPSHPVAEDERSCAKQCSAVINSTCTIHLQCSTVINSACTIEHSTLNEIFLPVWVMTHTTPCHTSPPSDPPMAAASPILLCSHILPDVTDTRLGLEGRSPAAWYPV
jgi:hypothetical protein